MADLRIFRSGQFRNYRKCNLKKNVFETLSRKVPDIIHKVSICYIKYGMLQTSLNNFGEEKEKENRKRNITITIGFCIILQKPNKHYDNNRFLQNNSDPIVQEPALCTGPS
jgi:hypothetical protein